MICRAMVEVRPCGPSSRCRMRLIASLIGCACHDARPSSQDRMPLVHGRWIHYGWFQQAPQGDMPFMRRRSEEHTSELQSLMRISYAVFCLKKKTTIIQNNNNNDTLTHEI